jgi:rubredoxin
MTKKRPIMLDLLPDWDEILAPWTCPDCKKSYKPPLQIFISPLDGRERCPKCSAKFHRGKS